MAFADVVKSKKGKKGADTEGANPFAKASSEDTAKPDAKPNKSGGKNGGFKKAVSNAKKKCCKGKC